MPWETKDLDWKSYYQEDFKRNEEKVMVQLELIWEELDPEPADILSNGGFLSFPHTHIRSSSVPIIRTIKGLYRSGIKDCLLIGVLHNISGGMEGNEFSLDNFHRIASLIDHVHGSGDITYKKMFLPRHSLSGIEARELRGMIDEYISEISDKKGESTAVIITGDLIHCGEVYGNPSLTEDILDSYKEMVSQDLYDVIVKKDVERSLIIRNKHLNDQVPISLSLSRLFEGEMGFKIFSSEMVDYSKILGQDEPALVSAVFYGAYPID